MTKLLTLKNVHIYNNGEKRGKGGRKAQRKEEREIMYIHRCRTIEVKFFLRKLNQDKKKF